MLIQRIRNVHSGFMLNVRSKHTLIYTGTALHIQKQNIKSALIHN